MPMIGALDSELKITEHENQEYQYRMTVVPVGIETFKNKITTYRFRLVCLFLFVGLVNYHPFWGI